MIFLGMSAGFNRFLAALSHFELQPRLSQLARLVLRAKTGANLQASGSMKHPVSQKSLKRVIPVRSHFWGSALIFEAQRAQGETMLRICGLDYSAKLGTYQQCPALQNTTSRALHSSSVCMSGVGVLMDHGTELMH
jgi:hypothetical protein